ncbi:hypothetical protein [Kytococcus sedentarius]|uniref:hypothetical protein n=1 Tax=Kytococcus sedentarius TaxID=1276 RepID=UPI00194EB758|nr:hypothetical protein [Kytococcus sedentarius]QRO86961.1 hypothetical protein I6J30_08960 [Kytococcus sedentarius]
MKMFGAILCSAALAGLPAAADTTWSYTTGGHAKAAGTSSIYACDTSADGHQTEAQSHHYGGATNFQRDNDGGSSCTGATYGTGSFYEFRACKLNFWKDTCDSFRRAK